MRSLLDDVQRRLHHTRRGSNKYLQICDISGHTLDILHLPVLPKDPQSRLQSFHPLAAV